MNKDKAKRILEILDQIGNEIDLLGKTLLDKRPKPIPVPVRETGRGRLK